MRITQANKSQLVVILYEIFFSYLEEAQDALIKEKKQEFCYALQKAQDCVSQLIGSLYMDQPLARTIYSVYLFVSGRIGLAYGKSSAEPLADAKRLMKKLYESYKADSIHDLSKPVMQQTQAVYAGLTYGKNCLNESLENDRTNRGFFV